MHILEAFGAHQKESERKEKKGGKVTNTPFLRKKASFTNQ